MTSYPSPVLCTAATRCPAPCNAATNSLHLSLENATWVVPFLTGTSPHNLASSLASCSKAPPIAHPIDW